ncbi:hypothetical protein SESBI_12377 [Sesbania bispinosa]|nr:hypothetical protein SESBI_12377 [Sesbania bispinosa]
MEQSRPPCTEDLTQKLHELLTDSDNDAVGHFSFKEETIEEVMQEFYKEIACPKPPSPTSSTPLSLSEHSSLSYSPNPEVDENVSLVQLQDGSDELVGLGNGVGQEKKILERRQDEVDFDDEWLARVLSWGQGQGQVMDTSDWF